MQIYRDLRILTARPTPTDEARAPSDWQVTTTPAIGAETWRGVVLSPPRAELYRRCDARLAAMAQAGAQGEVAALVARGLDRSLPVMKAVGVLAFAAELAGEASPAEALNRAAKE